MIKMKENDQRPNCYIFMMTSPPPYLYIIIQSVLEHVFDGIFIFYYLLLAGNYLYENYKTLE